MTMQQTSFTGRPVTYNEMAVRVPSVFASQAHDSRSERFEPIATIDVIRALERDNFLVAKAMQSKTRDKSRRDYTKHIVRLRHAAAFGGYMPHYTDGTLAEIVLKNGNDGSASFELMCGLFRIVCLNGLIAATNTYTSIKIRHLGKKEHLLQAVRDGADTVASDSVRALNAANQWSKIELSRDAQMELASVAHALRFEPGSPIAESIPADLLLCSRRRADTGDDLWSCFNRIQENATKGGFSGWTTYDENGRRRRRAIARPIGSVDSDLKLNRELWAAAERIAEYA